jgi:hypothetical protein
MQNLTSNNICEITALTLVLLAVNHYYFTMSITLLILETFYEKIIKIKRETHILHNENR